MADDASSLVHPPRGEPAASDGDWARPMLARQLAMLGELAEEGLQVARTIARQVTQAPSDEARPAPEAATSRAPRTAIRRFSFIDMGPLESV